MTRSMTAFGRGEAKLGEGAVVAEVRTVNARHLDLRLRLPRECSELEPEIRTSVSRCFSRGKVDLAIRVPDELVRAPDVTIDLELAGRYLEAVDALCKRFDLRGGLGAEPLLTLPGVVRLREAESPIEELGRAIRVATDRACEAASEMRSREGRALHEELADRLERVEQGITEIESRADEVRRGLRERLRRRIASLAPELALDPGRLDQEVVLYADRMDVTEETVRLKSHVAQFRESLASDEPVGRKLEFLLQELSREVNTVGSKVSDSEVARVVVELKTELEKLREQVLNVE